MKKSFASLELLTDEELENQEMLENDEGLGGSKPPDPALKNGSGAMPDSATCHGLDMENEFDEIAFLALLPPNGWLH